ncbi:MAG: ABC transporter six-transmembrane domain-containing protein [Ignavibacteria bacterium]|nr:ABC transporter six-transmembrane domain-containing protein [Ignavibacteria bacterium]
MNLFAIIKGYRNLILLALSLVIIENIAWIVEPFIFGKVIDAVIDVQIIKKEKKILEDTTKTEEEKKLELSEYEEFISGEGAGEKNTSLFDSLKIKFNENPEISILFPLSIWLFAFAINSGVGALRRSVDPKIFLKIYTKIATIISRNSFRKNIPTSKTTARVELSYQFIVFMQYRAPEIIENIINTIGALIALYYFDWRISLTCLFIIIPIYFTNKLYFKRVMPLQKEFHDEYEKIFEIFSQKDSILISKYFSNLAKPQKKIANWGAFNFSVIRVSFMIIFLVILYVSVELDEFSAGELYSIVAYLWTFITATEYLPELLENITSIRDISRRLKLESDLEST